MIAEQVGEVHVDMGYRGHDYTGRATVHMDKRRRARRPRTLWRWMKRRAAVEPSIGHLKTEHRLERNRLKGVACDTHVSDRDRRLASILDRFIEEEKLLEIKQRRPGDRCEGEGKLSYSTVVS